MKVCPTCDREYDDETQAFCLMDGAPLADAATMPTVSITGDPTSEPTVVMATGQAARPTTAYTKRKSKVPLIIGGVVVVILLAALGGAYITLMIQKGEAVQTNQNRAKATPAPSSTTTPQRAAVDPSPAATGEPTATASPGEVGDDVTPIAWTTSAATFKQETGLMYKFQCPPEGVAEAVWGSDIYTVDSSICTAAVHAGVITLKDGGNVTIEFRPGRSAYGSTTRNGITSNNYGEYPHSFVVR